jgi:hypothetical protein
LIYGIISLISPKFLADLLRCFVLRHLNRFSFSAFDHRPATSRLNGSARVLLILP